MVVLGVVVLFFYMGNAKRRAGVPKLVSLKSGHKDKCGKLYMYRNAQLPQQSVLRPLSNFSFVEI